MKKFLISFLLVPIFSFFSTTYGKVKPTYNAEYINQVIQTAQKSRTLKEFILKRNPKESPRQRFLLKYIKKYRVWKIPLIQRKKNVIHFQSNGFSAQLKVINDQKGSYQLNGHELKFSKEEKTKSRLKKITKILKASKGKINGVIEMLLPKAFAIWPVIATGVFIEELSLLTFSDDSLITSATGAFNNMIENATHLKVGRCKKDIESLFKGVKNLMGSKRIISQMQCYGNTVVLGMNKARTGPESTDTILTINRDQKIISESNKETGEFIQYVQNNDFTVRMVRYQERVGVKGAVYNEGDWGFDKMRETYKDYSILYEKIYGISEQCSCEDMKSVFYEAKDDMQFYEEYLGRDFKKKTSSAETQENSGVK